MTNDERKEMSGSAKLGIAGDISTTLTLLASLPYELGAVGVIVPPEFKPWVAGIGLFATLALRLWKRWTELQTANPS